MKPSHSDRGLRRLLTRPWAYATLPRLLSRRSPGWLVHDYVKPPPRARVLDLGCGPGTQVGFMADDVAEYVGVDMNAEYIAAAQRQYGDRAGFQFVCAHLDDFSPTRNHYDVVTAIGLLHHLNDEAARRFMAMAYNALAPGGRLITYDGVYIERQHPVATWLLNQDRGQEVRTVDGYRQLIPAQFGEVVEEILHDTLRLPYTTFVMAMTKA